MVIGNQKWVVMKQSKYKPLHKSWHNKAEEECTSAVNREHYLQGVNAFRDKALLSLQIFSALTNDTPIIYKNKVWVSLEDVSKLIEGLYAETIISNMGFNTKKKKKNG